MNVMFRSSQGVGERMKKAVRIEIGLLSLTPIMLVAASLHVRNENKRAVGDGKREKLTMIRGVLVYYIWYATVSYHNLSLGASSCDLW